MKLAIDIGNTSTKLALFDGKYLYATSNINDCNLKSIQKFVANNLVLATIISSVKEINSEILSISEHYKSKFISGNLSLPINNQYKTLNTLGDDRLAAAVGAYSLYPKNDIIVIDAGTCLTIDFLSAKGEYLGGRISPGIEMRYKSVNTFTDKLPLVKRKKSAPFIGNDTNSSIASGVQQGILAEVKSVISEYRLQKIDAIVVITGGDCFYFEKELKNSIFANPNLVLIGLNEILDLNE